MLVSGTEGTGRFFGGLAPEDESIGALGPACGKQHLTPCEQILLNGRQRVSTVMVRDPLRQREDV